MSIAQSSVDVTPPMSSVFPSIVGVRKSGEIHDSHKDQKDPRDEEQQRIERLYGTLPGKAHDFTNSCRPNLLGVYFVMPIITAEL